MKSIFPTSNYSIFKNKRFNFTGSVRGAAFLQEITCVVSRGWFWNIVRLSELENGKKCNEKSIVKLDFRMHLKYHGPENLKKSRPKKPREIK